MVQWVTDSPSGGEIDSSENLRGILAFITPMRSSPSDRRQPRLLSVLEVLDEALAIVCDDVDLILDAGDVTVLAHHGFDDEGPSTDPTTSSTSKVPQNQ